MDTLLYVPIPAVSLKYAVSLPHNPRYYTAEVLGFVVLC
jgi:hypothetical protein